MAEFPKYFHFRVLTNANGTTVELRDVSDHDFVEVVRCNDCVHYDKGENDRESWMYCKVLAKDVYDDFYCELGERREVQDGS